MPAGPAGGASDAPSSPRGAPATLPIFNTASQVGFGATIAALPVFDQIRLPHNGAVITLLAICGLTHREAYPDILVVAVLVPVVALVALIALGSIFGAF